MCRQIDASIARTESNIAHHAIYTLSVHNKNVYNLETSYEEDLWWLSLLECEHWI